ncbi:aminotransferase class IV [Streptomyces malaysiensis subsp. malaysiensis]
MAGRARGGAAHRHSPAPLRGATEPQPTSADLLRNPVGRSGRNDGGPPAGNTGAARHRTAETSETPGRRRGSGHDRCTERRSRRRVGPEAVDADVARGRRADALPGGAGQRAAGRRLLAGRRRAGARARPPPPPVRRRVRRGERRLPRPDRELLARRDRGPAPYRALVPPGRTGRSGTGPAVPADTARAAAHGRCDRVPDRGVRPTVASPPRGARPLSAGTSARAGRRARRTGAVAHHPSGTVLEGTGASVLWWEDDVLCLPPRELPLLTGVTSALIQDRAAELGVRTEHRRRAVRELDGREVWLVNAVHGIRPVTAWLGRPLRAGPALRAAAWQTWLDGACDPIP